MRVEAATTDPHDVVSSGASAGPARPPMWYLVTVIVALVPAAGIARHFTAQAGLSLWTPSVGIVFGVLFLYGIRWAPVLCAAVVAVTATPVGNRGAAWVVSFEVILGVVAGYTVGAAAARAAGVRPSLRRVSDAAVLGACGAGGSAIAVFAAVAIGDAQGYLGHEHFWAVFGRNFASSAAGTLVTAPVVILGGWWLQQARLSQGRGDTGRRQWAARLAEYLAQAAAFGALATLTLTQDHQAGTYYPMLIPLGWLALRRGVAGTSIGVALGTTALTVAAHADKLSAARVESLEVFIAVFAVCGLILGAAQTERTDVQRDLVDSRRALADKEEKLREAFDRLKDQANRDPMTLLPLRAMFIDQLVHSQSRAARSGRHVAVLYLDLDGFKAINDDWGHAVGDRAIVLIADRIRRAVRPSDTPSRPYTGGDEFMVLCDDLPTVEEAYVIADRVCDAVAEPLEVPGAGTFMLTVSVGIAFAGPLDDPESVVGEADRAMYKVKRQAS